jgi:excisionase family DNA binding protein
VQSCNGFAAAAESLRLLVTAREAADALCVSERKLFSMTKAGEIPCLKMGRAVRYALADLQTFIDRRRQLGDSGVKPAAGPGLLPGEQN